MNPTDREPLSPEERVLADCLARDGGHASPSAAVDAAILAAARNAAAPSAPARAAAAPASRQRRQRRWPLGVGIAASLALAVGIAWQLRPGPGDETPRALSEADMAAPVSARMASRPEPEAAAALSAPPVEPASEPVKSLSPPRPEPATVAAEPAPAPVQDAPAADAAFGTRPDEAEAQVERASTPGRERTPTSATAERRTALGAQAFPATPSSPPPPAAASLPAPAPPPAPPSPLAPADATTRRAAATPASAPQLRAARAESQAMLLESIDDVPDDADPPATADAPEVRAAWLARVRELLDAGRIDAARASLLEFRRRHPQAELPPDLQALLD